MTRTNIGTKFQEVKSLVNLSDVATRLGASLTKQSGSNTYHGTCPTGHASSSGKSFHIDMNKGLGFCFNCGIGGDAISLVEEVKGLTKWESLKWLVKEFNVKVDLGQPQHSPKPTPEQIKEQQEMIARSIIFEKIYEIGKKLLYEDEGKETLKYLTEERGYDVEVLKNTDWLYIPKDFDIKTQLINENPEMKAAIGSLNLYGGFGYDFRLGLPYRNRDSVITGILKRHTSSKGLNGKQRWDSTKGLNKDDLFGLDKVDVNEETLIIVEGYPDAIYLQALGIQNIVAIGQGGLGNKHLYGIVSRKTKNVIISLDNDKPKEEKKADTNKEKGKKEELTPIGKTISAVEKILKDTNITPYVIDPKEYGSHKDPDEYFKANGIDALKKIFDEKPQHGVVWVASVLTKDIKKANPIKKAEVKEKILELLTLVSDKNIVEEVRTEYPAIFPETKTDFMKLVKSKIVVDSVAKVRQSISQSITPFIDTNTNSRSYYNNLTDTLSLGVDEKIIEDIMLDYNLGKPSRYPVFKVQFNPHDMGDRFNIKNKSFNLFTPTEFMFQSKSDDEIDFEISCPRIFQLIRNLIPVEDERKHFINWLNYVFSTRSKARTSWVFRGAQGSGKNLFFDHIIKPLFGEKQAMVVDDDRLQSDFNGFILNKLFIAFNEVASVDTSSKRSVKSKIKAIISDEKALINEKHIRTYEIDNCANILFFSNEVIPILIEEGDRRFNVIETGSKLKNVSSFAADPTAFIKTLKDELSSFAQFLLNYKHSARLADDVIENNAKASIQELSMNRFELFASKLKCNDWDWFDENYPTIGFNGTYDRRSGLMTEKELESKRVNKDKLIRTFNSVNDGAFVSSTKLTQQLKLTGIVAKRKREVGFEPEHFYKWK
ncbi:MAG: DUF5906 domain-containing protein [Candidatus Kariarchaeaceae archaeon]